MKLQFIALGLLISSPAAAEKFHQPSRQFMRCSSVETMLNTCNESRVNQTICEWIDPPGHAKGYAQMIADGWLSQKKFEAACRSVCAGLLTVPDALSRFCAPGWDKDAPPGWRNK
ncbi:hypothetical protein [Bradyrhizobium genomosp. III]|uniref:hypothetical protein n=1 Tax=Bradyrhizobium genomosp. III TaxID=2683271 RepID=UPI0004B3537A|nr:hypothetical protein [Bradyrhizobium sp. CCBAU 15635]